MRLEGHVALITGVSHADQVGYALAAAFAREGALLSISARTDSRVNARVEALGVEGARVIAIPADLTTKEGTNTLVQETLAAYGRITILVNLAGAREVWPPAELMLAAWEAELNNNLRKESGIAVKAIGPGLINTQSNMESMEPTPEEIRAKWVSMEHIVEAALFLVSAAGDG